MVYSMIEEPKARVSEFVKNFETLAFLHYQKYAIKVLIGFVHNFDLQKHPLLLCCE